MKNRKVLWILLGAVVILAVIVGLLLETWAGLAVLLGGVLLCFSANLGKRTVGARYDPMVEGGRQNPGADRKQHPEDVPLNPWDSITGQGGSSE